MTIQASSNPLDNMLLQILQQRSQTQNTAESTPPPKPPKRISTQDLVTLSSNSASQTNRKNSSSLISEKTIETENGFRREQEFENEKGRKFTKIEDVTTTSNRSKRIVIQQNDSGSTTALENIIDRQDDGSFRLIQRYTDETGVTKTNVIPDFNPIDADILLGRPPTQSTQADNPFQATRGTQIDLSI